jgi:hypothetical protein|tara:strand:+ start:60 stop:602 length:543 start_codon:yes stop_codon:yes gene_type:complete
LDFDIIKVLAGFVSAIGAVAAYKFNRAQGQKFRAELIEKFELALEKGQRHATSELFLILHGLNMEFEEIEAVCAHRHSRNVIRALQKTPGMVRFENSRIDYTPLFQKRWFRESNRFMGKLLAYALGTVTIILIIGMATLDGIAAFAVLVILIPALAIWSVQVRDLRHERMIDGLISESET